MIETNVIKEIYKGHFMAILDFSSPSDLVKVIDESCKYVWSIEHKENSFKWGEYDYFLYGKRTKSNSILARNITLEYLIETSDFLQSISDIHQTIKIIQTNIVPPYYLDLERLKGKGKYDLLKERIDYLFEIEIPGAVDYASIVSPHFEFLEKVIDKFRYAH